MDGIDKGLVLFRSRPLIEHVLERLLPQVDRLLINANRSHEQYARYGHPVFADQVDGFAGPLAGLHAGMRIAHTPWVVTAPCDSPFLPLDLVARLAQSRADVAVARVEGRAQPVFLLARRELLTDLEAFLQAGGRKIDAWYSRLDHVEVDFPDPQAFANINTLAELQALDTT